MVKNRNSKMPIYNIYFHFTLRENERIGFSFSSSPSSFCSYIERLPIHSSPANLIIVIIFTLQWHFASKLEQNTYSWLVSLQIHQNLNKLHQYSKNYIGFQSNNASITNCVFLHIKHFKFSTAAYLSLQ